MKTLSINTYPPHPLKSKLSFTVLLAMAIMGVYYATLKLSDKSWHLNFEFGGAGVLIIIKFLVGRFLRKHRDKI